MRRAGDLDAPALHITRRIESAAPVRAEATRRGALGFVARCRDHSDARVCGRDVELASADSRHLGIVPEGREDPFDLAHLIEEPRRRQLFGRPLLRPTAGIADHVHAEHGAHELSGPHPHAAHAFA